MAVISLVLDSPIEELIRAEPPSGCSLARGWEVATISGGQGFLYIGKGGETARQPLASARLPTRWPPWRRLSVA
eukprot:scaffold1146_cov399-Prasinococcus_capsulatus_cf.AAC.36